MKLTKTVKNQLEASKAELLEAKKHLDLNEVKLAQMAIDLAIGWMEYALGGKKLKKRFDNRI